MSEINITSRVETGSTATREPETLPRSSYEHLPPSVCRVIEGVWNNRYQMSPVKARDIVQEADLQAEDLMPWSDFDHPARDSYGRKLLFNGGFFEIMVMSWVPGDISAIHDHGYTQWGAVQVFGPAEHAAYMISDNAITTVSREVFETGRVIPVGHELVHQLGNPTQERFLTLHMYGHPDPTFNLSSVTANARVYDITEGSIQRTDGGMFFILPEERINTRDPAPEPDQLSYLRNTVEIIRRIRRARSVEEDLLLERMEDRFTEQLFRADRFEEFERDLFRFVDENGHMTQLNYWKLLREELIHTASLQKELIRSEEGGGDSFHTYAALYDEVIGTPCLESFIAGYLEFFRNKYSCDFMTSRLLSIGCGTGIMEEHILKRYSMYRENLLGIDISSAMVKEASLRINARVEDILTMDTSEKWDVTFAGLNVFQYLPRPGLERAIQKAAALTKTGGYFLGDFVTPDHVRWYPHVIRSRNVISLRNPRLVEKDRNTYQESEIINVSRKEGRFRVTYEGKHLRYMPSLWKVRYLFTKLFGGKVDFYDAVTLEPLKLRDDTAPSTRYLVVARKA